MAYLRDMIRKDSDYEVNQFNVLIDDINARCGSFKYRPGVLQNVENDLWSVSPMLKADAQAIVKSWRQGNTSTGQTATIPVQTQRLLDLNARDDAKAVQQKLKDGGLYTWTVDGVFGERSRDALTLFKITKGLPNDSVWDMATQRTLFGQ